MAGNETQLPSEGWGFFEHASDPQRGAAEQRARSSRGEKAALQAARLAATAEFRELFAYLRESTLDRATYIAQFGLDPMQAYCFGVFREGQNSMMTAIEKLIALGQKQQPPEERQP